jgi:hypothetical protein
MPRFQKGRSGNPKGRPRGTGHPKILKTRRAIRVGQDFLYIFEQEGYYKIGISNDPARRLSALQSSTPFEVKIFFVLEFGGDAEPIEKALHEYFSRKHIRGEWYKLSKQDLDFVRSYVSDNKMNILVKQPRLIDN